MLQWLNCSKPIARVLAADTGKEVASIKIGAGPDAVIYDPKNEVALVPRGESGDLEIVAVGDATKVAKIQTLKLPPLARTGAVDSDGRLYAMAAR